MGREKIDALTFEKLLQDELSSFIFNWIYDGARDPVMFPPRMSKDDWMKEFEKFRVRRG